MKITRYYWIPLVLVAVVSTTLLLRNLASKNEVENNTASADLPKKSNGIAPSVPLQLKVQDNKMQSPARKKQIVNYTLPDIQERLDVMQKRRPDAEFSSAAVEAAMKREDLWGAPKQIPKDLPLKPEEFVDGRQFIAFDSLKMETLVPGDSLKIAIDEHRQNYEIIIDKVEQHDYESITWHGHLDGGNGQTYATSFTRGKELTVGGIDTPEGNYVIQSHGDKGWVASSGLLFKADPDGDDIVLPRGHSSEEESL
jgi:hypothetical protein